MRYRYLFTLSFLLLASLAAPFLALAELDESSTSPTGIKESGGLKVTQAGSADIALIETRDTTDSVVKILEELGYSYDYYVNSFPTDYSVYEVIIQAMDGGTDNQVPELSSYIEEGGCGILIGGSRDETFATEVKTYLMDVNTTNYYWTTVSGTPDLTVTDPEHCLTQGLPQTYNLVNNSASFYMFRINDTEVEVAAVNGDGEKAIVAKDLGSGRFICFINSPYDDYWQNTDDYNYLKTFVGNAITCCSGIRPRAPVGGGIITSNKTLVPGLLFGVATLLAIIVASSLSQRKSQ